MEVLLLQDIQGIGKKNDLLIVGDGYALNFLLPQSKAMIATPTVRRRFAEHIRRRALEAEQERKATAATVQAAAGKEIVLTKKVTKTGKLYAAITKKHIAEALKAQHSLGVKESSIKITEPIKTTGSFDVAVKIGQNAEKLTVTVKAEK
ncbi:MAG: 50S ribosomal protein L9 [Candidatus Peribacteraceae bacterium]|nr:50S ribosomal protein L9 [Candidatus Peribacteraceae bacterium]